MLPLDLHSGMIISSRSSGPCWSLRDGAIHIEMDYNIFNFTWQSSKAFNQIHEGYIQMILSIFAATIKGAKELVQENGAGGYKGVVVKVCDVVVMDVCVMDVVVLDVSV